MQRELQIYDKLCPEGLVLAPEQNQCPLAFLFVVQFPRQVDIWRHQKRRTYGILFNFQSINNSLRYITWSFDSCHFNFTEIFFLDFRDLKAYDDKARITRYKMNIPFLNSKETLINPKRTQVKKTILWFITSNIRAVYIESNEIKKSCLLKTDVGTLVQALTKVAHSSADVLKCFDSTVDSKVLRLLISERIFSNSMVMNVKLGYTFNFPFKCVVIYRSASKISRTPPLLAGLPCPDERPPPQLAPVVGEWFVEISHHDQVYIQVIHLYTDFDSSSIYVGERAARFNHVET